MNQELFIKTATCPGYESLLEECNHALEIWNDYREEVKPSRLSGQKIGDDLLRLQANYARAYSRLERHAHECPICPLLPILEEPNCVNISGGRIVN